MTRLSLSFLGTWQAQFAGGEVPNFKYDKVRALLAYLAVEADRAHRREALLGLLWPELDESAARNNLRQVIYLLRQALGDRQAGAGSAPQPFLLASRATLQFNAQAAYELDVESFVAHIQATARHAHRNIESCPQCARRLEEALRLYRGPFLADFFLAGSSAFETWAQVKREWLQQMALDAMQRLAAHHERWGRYERARAYVQRQLALEPWHEAAHRSLMRLHALEGARAAALAQYERCRRLLDEEVGVAPEPATTALFEQIRAASEESPLPLAQLALPAQQPHTLPPAPTPFVGREAELAALARLLADQHCRLLTLIGPGGAGKSRLALQAAAAQLDAFAGGVFFVPLAALPTAQLLAETILEALGLPLEGHEPAQAALLRQLRSRQLLLLLDNFEHLTAGAGLLAEILRHAPGVKLLVTSRQRLNLQAEWLFEVGGLPCHSGETGDGDDAAALFLQSARRVRPDFVAGGETAAQIARICRLLGGLPLTIELAAGWVQLLSCAEIAAQIEQDLAFLATGARDAPQRHHSLLAVFEETWRRLSEEEQRVLAQLSLFQGGFRLKAAQTVAGATLFLLRRFMDKSLLQRDAAGRYTMHTLLQRYAAERLAESEHGAPLRHRYLHFFLELAQEASAQLRGPQSVRYLALLEAERDNLRAALSYALGSEQALRGPALGYALGPEQALRGPGLALAAALWPFWYRRGYLAQGRQWLARALAYEREAEPAVAAALHHGAGVLAWNQGDYAAAHDHYEHSLALRRALGDEQGMAALLNNLGNLALDQGQIDAARRYLEQSLAIKRRLGDEVGISASLGNLGVAAYEQADFAAARAYLEESMALKLALGDSSGAAIPMGTLGAIAVKEGAFAEARPLLERSLALKQEAGDRWGMAMTLEDLGILAIQEEQLDEARRRLAESLALRRQLGDRWSLASALEAVGKLALAQGRPAQAARLWGAAQAISDRIGAAASVSRQRQYAAERQQALAQLEAAAVDAAYEAGRALDEEQALREAAALLQEE